MSESSEAAIPRQIGAWNVVRLLGKGGMAEVYEVEDVRLGIRYALKLFTYARGRAEGARERFISEGRLLARLDHPRLVRVYDVGEDEATGCPYFVMQLVVAPDGVPRTLADLETPDEEQVAAWYEDLREGLAYIHGKGILHRDLKLQNVLLGPDGHVLTKTALPERDRNVYRAYALEGRDIAKVARTFGISRNSVSQIKTRIDKRIVSVGRELIRGA